MKNRIIQTLIVMIFILHLVGCSNSNKGVPQIEWVDFIKFEGITYYSNDYLSDAEKNNIELGEVFKTVKKKIADVVYDTNYVINNGDAAFHDIGTKVYSVVGYDTKFRLAVEADYGIRLYEAHRNPNATTGNDILDIKDKVKYITLNSEEDAQTVITTIENELDVKKIVDIILDSPLDEDTNRKSDKRYFLELHLHDGTSVTRCYWYDDNILVPNIKLFDTIVDIFNKYLDETDKMQQLDTMN